jgi:2-haloacid dehalogenase/putative hydrolase of the HAD superfamily
MWPRGILLDFYGTVVKEDNAQMESICNEVAEASATQVSPKDVNSRWGRVFDEMCLESHGEDFRSQKELGYASLKEVLSYFDADLDAGRLTQTQFDYGARPEIYPESKRVIAKCSVPICIVSNIDNAELRCALGYHGLSFDGVITSEDCMAYKPRSERFERALSLLGLSNKDVLHVGDSLRNDVGGAKALEIPVLWVNRSNRRPRSGDEQPDYTSTDLTGVTALLNRD